MNSSTRPELTGPHLSFIGNLPLIWFALFLIIFGCRLIVCNHYAVDVPYFDDWVFVKGLAENRSGSLFGSDLFKVHVQHIIAFTRLEQLLVAKYNGIWQLRVGNVLHAIPFSCFALVSALAVNRALPGRQWVVFGAALITFAIPWAGDRTLWSLLSSFSWMMFWSVVQVLVITLVDRKYLRLGLSLFICSLASISMGAGSLTAIITAGWSAYLLLRGQPGDRKINTASIILHLGLFFFFYLLVPKEDGGLASDLWTTIKAFLRCLAYPTVNLWILGPLMFLPWILLAFKIALRKTLPTKEEALLLLLGSVVLLQSLGVAVFSGANNNGGIPASRYYEVLFLGPLVNFAIIVHYLSVRPMDWVRHLALPIWTMITLAGFLLVLFWRVTPWLSLDSGEWEAGLKQAVIASWTRGEIPALPDYIDKVAPEISFLEGPRLIGDSISLSNDSGALIPAAMIGGFPLTPAPGSEGFQLNGGYPDNRKPRPWLRYWGSYEPTSSPDHNRRFESMPVELTSPYVQFDFLFDKKSRFRFYNFPNSSLKLVNVASGTEIDILRLIPRSFPSILMDREAVCTKLPAPGSYKLIAEDNALDSGWFAFSEPSACGPLGAWAQTILNSGKLIVFCGLMLLVVAAFSTGFKMDEEAAARRLS